MKTTLSVLLLATISSGAIAAPQAQRGPSTKAEVLQLVSGRVPGSVVAETVLRNGISFEPTEEVLSEFRNAGATDDVIKAMRESWRWESKKPLSEKDILELLAEHMPAQRIFNLIEQRQIGFEPTDECLQGLRSNGAGAELIDALRASPRRPFSKDYLLQLLADQEDAGRIGRGVEQRGINFDPSEEDLSKLRAAGASETLLQAIQGARRVKAAYVSCPPVVRTTPVFAGPVDTNTVVTDLTCFDRVLIEEKDSGKPGIDKVFLADGREGFVQDSYLRNSIPRGHTSAPVPTYRPDPPYTPQARHAKRQGTVTLMIVVDSQGNVTDARETSKPLGGGLDEKAIETVKTWKFKPATRDGVPIPVRVIVEVTFRLFR